MRRLLDYPVRHAGHPVFSINNGYANLKFNALGWLSYVWGRLTGSTKAHMDMRRRSYE